MGTLRFAEGILKGRTLDSQKTAYKIVDYKGEEVAKFSDGNMARFYRDIRCTVCGSPRVMMQTGDPGACSLIGCKDPLRDYRFEKGLDAISPEALASVAPETVQACDNDWCSKPFHHEGPCDAPPTDSRKDPSPAGAREGKVGEGKEGHRAARTIFEGEPIVPKDIPEFPIPQPKVFRGEYDSVPVGPVHVEYAKIGISAIRTADGKRPMGATEPVYRVTGWHGDCEVERSAVGTGFREYLWLYEQLRTLGRNPMKALTEAWDVYFA